MKCTLEIKVFFQMINFFKGARILADFLELNKDISLIDLKGNNIGP